VKFGWINLFGALIVVIMLIPNIVYANRDRGKRTPRAHRAWYVTEQTGRYACIVLMWLPLLVWKFGFGSVGGMLVYLAGNGALLVAYLVVFARFLRRKTPGRALALAALPAGIFLLSGALLRHWLLVIGGAVFAVSHIYITKKDMDAAHFV